MRFMSWYQLGIINIIYITESISHKTVYKKCKQQGTRDFSPPLRNSFVRSPSLSSPLLEFGWNSIQGNWKSPGHGFITKMGQVGVHVHKNVRNPL